jgi:hypothetical protein
MSDITNTNTDFFHGHQYSETMEKVLLNDIHVKPLSKMCVLH